MKGSRYRMATRKGNVGIAGGEATMVVVRPSKILSDRGGGQKGFITERARKLRHIGRRGEVGGLG